MNSSRREFLVGIGRLVVVLPAGAAFTRALVACNTTSYGNGGPDGGGGGACGNADGVTSGSTSVTVTSTCVSGHTHDFTIARTELSSPPANGDSGDTTPSPLDGHVHMVELTHDDLASIAGGATVAKDTTTVNGHSHTFHFRTAGGGGGGGGGGY